MAPVRAKFRYTGVSTRVVGVYDEETKKNNDMLQHDLEFYPVTGGSDENKLFWKWSPSGKIVLGTVNHAAAEYFKLGREYYIDFTEAPA